MKKLLFLFVASALLLVTSCNQHQQEIAHLKAQNDSLLALKYQSDTTVMDFFRTFNAVQANLDSIKQRENIISKTTGNGEVQKAAKDQIINDINAIYSLLQKNRELVNQLRAKLKNSDKRLVELEKVVDNLNKQIEEKNLEIAQLKDDLSKANIKVEDLSVKVKDLNTTVENLSEDVKGKEKVIEDKTTELNTAYYVVGTTRELRDKNIITRTGGFIGIGKTSSMKDIPDKTQFTKVDITKVTKIPIYKSKATLVTQHPTTSYTIDESKTGVESITITDPKEFWSMSKYLVINAK